MNKEAAGWRGWALVFLAGVLLVLLSGLSDIERQVPNYYADAVQVTGVYSRQDLAELTAAIPKGEPIRWIRVPTLEGRAFARGEIQRLPSDIAEVQTGGPTTGSLYELRKRDGVWKVTQSAMWLR